MSYDSLFGTAPPKPPPPSRRRPPWTLLLLVLAVLGAAVVCIPLTRMVGLGVVAVLAVPVAVFWHRERGNAGHWAATAALGVLGAAFLAGGVVTLVNTGVLAPGSPRWAVNLPPDELTRAPEPDELAPGGAEAGPPTTPLPNLPPPAAAQPPVKSAPTAAKPAAPKPTQAVTKPTPTATATRRRDAPAPDRGGRNRDHDGSSPTTTTEPQVDGSCPLGAVQPSPDGSVMVCAQPNGAGGYSWQPTDGRGYGNF
ncbi:MAG: hypothetical protein J2P20_03365 [Pseudonocardia sp.]|nr:hypothetical protein [Pseudonocardia sp.]